jgi:hypothetical protein
MYMLASLAAGAARLQHDRTDATDPGNRTVWRNFRHCHGRMCLCRIRLPCVCGRLCLGCGSKAAQDKAARSVVPLFSDLSTTGPWAGSYASHLGYDYGAVLAHAQLGTETD